MALKFKVAWCLGIFTGLLTFFLSFMYGVRVANSFYRGVFTAGLFFALGYFIFIFVESYFKKLLEKDAHKGKKIDITDKGDSNILVGEGAPEQEEPGTSFKPLNPDELTILSPTQE